MWDCKRSRVWRRPSPSAHPASFSFWWEVRVTWRWPPIRDRRQKRWGVAQGRRWNWSFTEPGNTLPLGTRAERCPRANRKKFISRSGRLPQRSRVFLQQPGDAGFARYGAGIVHAQRGRLRDTSLLSKFAFLPLPERQAFPLNFFHCHGNFAPIPGGNRFQFGRQPLVVLQLAALELLQALLLLRIVGFQGALPLHGILQDVLNSHTGRFQGHHQRAVFGRRRQAVQLVA